MILVSFFCFILVSAYDLLTSCLILKLTPSSLSQLARAVCVPSAALIVFSCSPLLCVSGLRLFFDFLFINLFDHSLFLDLFPQWFFCLFMCFFWCLLRECDFFLDDCLLLPLQINTLLFYLFFLHFLEVRWLVRLGASIPCPILTLCRRVSTQSALFQLKCTTCRCLRPGGSSDSPEYLTICNQGCVSNCTNAPGACTCLEPTGKLLSYSQVFLFVFALFVVAYNSPITLNTVYWTLKIDPACRRLHFFPRANHKFRQMLYF